MIYSQTVGYLEIERQKSKIHQTDFGVFKNSDKENASRSLMQEVARICIDWMKLKGKRKIKSTNNDNWLLNMINFIKSLIQIQVFLFERAVSTIFIALL